MIKIKHIAIGTFLSFSAYAGTMGAVSPTEETNPHPWSVVGSIGYTYYGQTAAGGGTPVGRLGIAKNIYNFNGLNLGGQNASSTPIHLGLEFGVQNGNRMSLSIPQTTIDTMGGLPVWTTVKPMLDLLGTLEVQPVDTIPAFLLVKGGVAWREWMLERDTINNKSQAAGEIQAGIGMFVSKKTTLSVLYQGIFGSNPNFSYNTALNTGTVSNIAAQNGVLLSLSMTL